ncbi:hypothetical protein D3C73_675010 [compost metagenome]
MTDALPQSIAQAVEVNFLELIKVGNLKPGQLVVFGTSTSEVLGHHIGTSGTMDAAEPIYRAAKQVADQCGLSLAFQCCEHLNRALVVEEEWFNRYPMLLEQVAAIPVPRAGGSMAAYAYRHFTNPVLVESIQAHAGIDIGDTMIGMHLRRVAVPMRPPIRMIGHAHVSMAYTRPKLIGGTRAIYTEAEAERLVRLTDQSRQTDDCSLT